MLNHLLAYEPGEPPGLESAGRKISAVKSLVATRVVLKKGPTYNSFSSIFDLFWRNKFTDVQILFLTRNRNAAEYETQRNHIRNVTGVFLKSLISYPWLINFHTRMKPIKCEAALQRQLER
jgi:hypothetical protein